MNRFESEEDLQRYLLTKSPDYGQYAPILWVEGCRCLDQLAYADTSDLKQWGIKALHATHIKASAGHDRDAAQAEAAASGGRLPQVTKSGTEEDGCTVGTLIPIKQHQQQQSSTTLRQRRVHSRAGVHD
mmetsp:Transcript_21782/g.55442  ORF Transcript_21782/g.55442 Transcript_21782/m.55442 type:complete len:129 (-) Transcript_21782:549-935(-)|eukprot:CAMPEP_0202870568 /NCGR_PEP_ID=MMETSP1391-20130828/16089_1 /ASSEMBLY_ACC=CAM_ASM_000867 /TAXON_ID=1034604 /ORGANISM="Chlamydomonas leiostraca, Strain SAG 11-49" /LENGTH=128 /DNA_ID=CAMNT_0049551169 /DNA_START=99 /DNA_END=485 /DNA_ORIENTATION=-